MTVGELILAINDLPEDEEVYVVVNGEEVFYDIVDSGNKEGKNVIYVEEKE